MQDWILKHKKTFLTYLYILGAGHLISFFVDESFKGFFGVLLSFIIWVFQVGVSWFYQLWCIQTLASQNKQRSSLQDYLDWTKESLVTIFILNLLGVVFSIMGFFLFVLPGFYYAAKYSAAVSIYLIQGYNPEEKPEELAEKILKSTSLSLSNRIGLVTLFSLPLVLGIGGPFLTKFGGPIWLRFFLSLLLFSFEFISFPFSILVLKNLLKDKVGLLAPRNVQLLK